MRIIVAASTDKFSFVPIRDDRSALTDASSTLVTVTLIMNIAIPASALLLPEAMISENSILFSLGDSIPISVATIIAKTSMTISDTETCCTMYLRRLPIFILVSGNGL